MLCAPIFTVGTDPQVPVFGCCPACGSKLILIYQPETTETGAGTLLSNAAMGSWRRQCPERRLTGCV